MVARLLLAFLLVITLASLAAAQDKGHGSNGGHGGGAAQSSESNAGSVGISGSDNQGNGNAWGPPADAKGSGERSHRETLLPDFSSAGNRAISTNLGGSSGVTALTPDQALSLVQRQQVLPLSNLAKIVRQRSGAEVVDAELLKIGQILVYAIREIDQTQHLSIQYYYARSGRYIGGE